MYLVDDEVMQYALGKMDNVKMFAVLYPSMKVVPIIEDSYELVYNKPAILHEPNKVERYVKHLTENVNVRLNRDKGILEVYHPYNKESE